MSANKQRCAYRRAGWLHRCEDRCQPPTKTKDEVIATQILVYQENNKIIDSKVLAIKIASIGLCLEVVGLIVLLLIQIL